MIGWYWLIPAFGLGGMVGCVSTIVYAWAQVHRLTVKARRRKDAAESRL
jgi:ABC-type proline/glycine betaine transport system permease subunit